MEDLLLALVGEQFDAPEGEVLGLVLSLKYNNDTISVWHRNAKDADLSQRLLKSIESHVQIREDMAWEHEIFEDVLNAPPREPRPYKKVQDFSGGNSNTRGAAKKEAKADDDDFETK